ncbi:MAG TPA: phytanoyl-CoA dioxygenase family protein [Acetobacteraceae bacterium]|nr:phytanoyl-CoA dioxygenase family protein [Acetobacteraceae bacterium]
MDLVIDDRRQAPITFSDLAEDPSPKALPWLDRPGVDESRLQPDQLSWRQQGIVIKRKFLPDRLTDAYIERRAQFGDPGGWRAPTPYLHVPEMRALALYPPLMRLMADLIGEPMLLHLALTGWVSTERNWHQDDYLNPDFVNSWYCAVWMALGPVDPDCGPFEYVPGSHQWPLLRGEKVRRFLSEEERGRREGPLGTNHWPKYSERYVVPAIEAEIVSRGVAPARFLAEKGDVLIWHGRLMHRGSRANVPGKERRSLITHYSGCRHRPDMTEQRKDENGMAYAWFDHPLA